MPLLENQRSKALSSEQLTMSLGRREISLCACKTLRGKDCVFLNIGAWELGKRIKTLLLLVPLPLWGISL